MTGRPLPCQPAPFDFAQDGLEAIDAAAHGIGMAKKDKKREERLAAALRENLKRRKAQARAQDQETKSDKDA
jgi:hypothetical protein